MTTRSTGSSSRREFLSMRAAVRDPLTGLHTYAFHFDQVRARLARKRALGVLWINLGDRRLAESIYGWEVYDRVIRRAGEYLESCKGRLIGDQALLASAGPYSDSFVVFLPADLHGRGMSAERLAAVATDLARALEAELDRDGRTAGLAGTVRIGQALMADNPFHRFERRVYQFVDQARRMVEKPGESERLAWSAELQRVLRSGTIESVFQPIFDLATNEVVGHEAFTRGPRGSALQMPRVMFSVGRELGLADELDRACRDRALKSYRGRDGELLFVNTTATNLSDARWTQSATLDALQRGGGDPTRVVLEVSETEVEADADGYSDALIELRAAGYRLSLDDIGSGAESMRLVDRLRPEFLKFDLTLVRQLAENPLQREVVGSLVRLAEQSGACLIAECVETESELNALRECGTAWGQGHHLGAEIAGADGAP